jgi:DNA-binding NarL/FixJ family response regulator
VVDIADPDVDGVETIRSIKGAMYCAHVVALTMGEAAEYCEELACAGASAYILIWRTQTELVPLIRAILAADTGGPQRTATASII